MELNSWDGMTLQNEITGVIEMLQAGIDMDMADRNLCQEAVNELKNSLTLLAEALEPEPAAADADALTACG